MAFRYDVGELRKPVKTEQGFLRVDGYVSRPGIYEYVNTPKDEKDGLGKAGVVRREFRPEDEVFRADSLAGFEDAPITLGHPGKMVDVKTAKAVKVGVVKTAARRDGERASATLLIDDPKAIERLESGKMMQLSPGYRIDEDRTPGTDPKYGKYDLVQRNIRINHLALVDRARGGADLSVRMDGEDVSVERSDDWMPMDIPRPNLIALTTVVDGHQHTLCPDADSGVTSHAFVEGSEVPHHHEWIRTVDGKITLAENAGHTHEVDASTIGVRDDADDLDAAARDKLSDADFAYPEKKKLPINDEKHVRAAMSRFASTEWASDDKDAEAKAYKRIVAAATKLKIDTSGFEKKYGSRFDGADSARSDTAATARQGATMADQDRMDTSEQIGLLKVRLDAAEKIATERKDAIDTAVRRADSAEAALKTAKEKIEALQGAIAAGSSKLETKAIKEHAQRADEAERKLRDLEASIPKLIGERCDAITKAQAVLGDNYTAVSKSNREIHIDVIKKLRPKDATDPTVSDASIAARFDSLIEDRTRAARSLERLDEQVVERQRFDGVGEVQTPDQRTDHWNNLATKEGPRGYTLGGK